MAWIVGIPIVVLFIVTTNIVHAQSLRNFGNDPFVRVSSAIASCPEPAGPRVSEEEWKREAHHRIEEGNHCYAEGRCRLANAYQYDKEIAEALKRRLADLGRTLPAWQDSSLWIMVRGRWLTVQGCVGKDFNRAAFLAAMREIPDVEKVIDQTIAMPARDVPYARYPAKDASSVTNTPNR
ncbi:BON domain-containing protein [Cupriavidus pauculus]|uniref:BON domain-containing protein n=1 Tax=Cupriavidus pauculus TaxID=82633 RepID=A0A2N5CAN2_9BURK|nr:BON domain-containing protein [Cupriavidus pauculus]PLP99288.1 hypothetical protein CYJ10_18570 [Cupriavidus pauculus]